MVIRRRSSKVSSKYALRKYALRIWLLAIISSVVLTAGVLEVSTRTVQADVLPSRPAVTAPSAVPAASATPAALHAPQKPAKTATACRLHGIASWYGGVFNGRYTASGERYDMNAMTACHPTLPFGTVVRVVNRDNNRSVVVRITDRGDLVEKRRIIDLSYGAAKKLEMTESGLARVDLHVISLGGSRSGN
jgi:rare lipoprotein A